MHLKTLSAKSRPLCLGLTVLSNQPISLQPTNQIEYATTPEYEESTKIIITAMKETQLLYKNPGPDHDPITSKEMNEAIKKLKRKKSLGPDGIPNEIFIEAEPETRNNTMQYNTRNPQQGKHTKKLVGWRNKKTIQRKRNQRKV